MWISGKMFWKDWGLAVMISMVFCQPLTSQQTGGLITDIITETDFAGAFSELTKTGTATPLRYDMEDYEKTWNINADLNWANNYSKMYPAGAARMIENSISFALPQSADGIYLLTIRPLDPGIVFYKIIIDTGGYLQTRLKMRESPYERQ